MLLKAVLTNENLKYLTKIYIGQTILFLFENLRTQGCLYGGRKEFLFLFYFGSSLLKVVMEVREILLLFYDYKN